MVESYFRISSPIYGHNLFRAGGTQTLEIFTDLLKNNRVCTIRTSAKVLVLVLVAESEPFKTHSDSVWVLAKSLVSLKIETEPRLEVVL